MIAQAARLGVVEEDQLRRGRARPRLGRRVTQRTSTEPHAAVVEHFGKPLALREWAIPTPGPGQIVVKTEACGLCHTDLHAANGDCP